MDAFLGEIRPVPYGQPPKHWVFCEGQILSIAQNTALFSLLGTTYGGNGQTTFALPDLRGRIPNSSGKGPGLDDYSTGQVSGEEFHTLTTTEIPIHNHLVSASVSKGTSNTPVGNTPATPTGNIYAPAINAALAPDAITTVGSGVQHENRQPFLVIRYMICVEGNFPKRN